MKTLTLILGLCMVVVVFTDAQEKNRLKTKEQRHFKKAYDFYDDGDLQRAAAEFKEFMVEYPRSVMIAKAHYNVAYINYQLKDYRAAKIGFKEILTKPYLEMDANSLMEPYALYKHRASRCLAEIALEEKDYDAAEEYIEMFDKKYKYQHFCGNEWAVYHQDVALMRAQVYEGRKEISKALELLLPLTFNEFLVSNDPVLDRLIHLLEANYSKESIREELARSQKSIEVKVDGNGTLMLYGVKVEIWAMPNAERLSKDFTGEAYFRDIVTANRLYRTFL